MCCSMGSGGLVVTFFVDLSQATSALLLPPDALAQTDDRVVFDWPLYPKRQLKTCQD